MSDNLRYLLSAQQAEVWQAHVADGHVSSVVQHVVALAPTALAETLDRALTAAVARHEILRTTFRAVPGQKTGVQIVHDELVPSIRAVAGPYAEHAATERGPFALDGSPIRVVLCDAGTHNAALIVTMSALAGDAASLTIVTNEILQPDTAIAEPLQYADYAAWQEDLLAEPESGARQQAWETPTDAESVRLPFQPATASSAHDARVSVAIDNAALAAAASRLTASPQDVVLAGWIAWLARTNRAANVAVAYRSDGRNNDDIVGAVGPFARLVPLSVATDIEQTFASLVADVAQLRADAENNIEYFTDAAARVRARELTGPRFASEPSATTLVAASGDRDGAELRWLGGRAELFVIGGSQQVVASQAESIADFIAAACADERVAIGALRSTSTVDEHRLVLSAQGASSALEVSTFTAGFERQASLTPQRVAVANGAVSLTYQELDAAANQLAQVLVRRGVRPGANVGLLTDRSPSVIVAVLGILKAGAAYVPLNHEHPASRLSYQLAETTASIVVVTDAFRGLVPSTAEPLVIDVPATFDGVSTEPVALARAITGDDVAYVLYTSGSTGTPKGVMVTHTNVVNYASHIARRIASVAGAQNDDALRCGVVTAISTDLGNTCIMPPLMSGGSVQLIDADIAMDPFHFVAHVLAHPVDVLKVTPSHLTSLLSTAGADVLPKRLLVLGGEASSWELVESVRAAAPRLRILNHYGPTETTVGACTYEVLTEPADWQLRSVPIGSAIANMACDVVDAAGGVVPIGMPGELIIGGVGVAKGYVGSPELTNERFIDDPRRAGQRAYRTGDLVQRLPDGNLEFLGRIDDQVKIRGHRVEPREVAQVLADAAGIAQIAVVAREYAPGDMRLVAYVVSDAPLNVASLRSIAVERLPEVMVPAAFVRIAALPLTPSGKLDRRALPDPESVNERAVEHIIEPRTATEIEVARAWREVLGLETLSIDEDFFVLGGHSLLATQIVARVRQAMNVELPLHALFVAPTVAGLAALVDELAGGDTSDADHGAADVDDELAALLEGMSDEEIAQLLGDV